MPTHEGHQPTNSRTHYPQPTTRTHIGLFVTRWSSLIGDRLLQRFSADEPDKPPPPIPAKPTGVGVPARGPPARPNKPADLKPSAGATFKPIPPPRGGNSSRKTTLAPSARPERGSGGGAGAAGVPAPPPRAKKPRPVSARPISQAPMNPRQKAAASTTGWIEKVTLDGVIYYYNTATQETAWHLPQSSAFV